MHHTRLRFTFRFDYSTA